MSFNLNIYKEGYIPLISNIFEECENIEYYKDYKMKHPGELILQKFDLLNSSTDDILKIKDSFFGFDTKHKQYIINYLINFQSFNESLLNVIKAFTSPTEENIKNSAPREVHKWLFKYNKEVYEIFKKNTKDYKIINESANILKHSGYTMTSIEITNHKKQKIKGFYFSEIINNQFSAPNKKIHKVMNDNILTAFSFNHFLLRTAGILALNLYTLNKVLFNNTKIKTNSFKNRNIYSYFNKILKIEKVFFPDEYNYKLGHITLNKNMITVQYKKYITTDKFDKISSVSPAFQFDYKGSSREHIPYLQLVK